MGKINFEKTLPRKKDETKVVKVLNPAMAAKLVEEEAKREADEILRPKVNMDKSFAAQGHIPRTRGGVSFNSQLNRTTGKLIDRHHPCFIQNVNSRLDVSM